MKVLYTIFAGIPLLMLLGLVVILSVPLFLLSRSVGLGEQYFEFATKVGNAVCENFKLKVSSFS